MRKHSALHPLSRQRIAQLDRVMDSVQDVAADAREAKALATDLAVQLDSLAHSIVVAASTVERLRRQAQGSPRSLLRGV